VKLFLDFQINENQAIRLLHNRANYTIISVAAVKM